MTSFESREQREKREAELRAEAQRIVAGCKTPEERAAALVRAGAKLRVLEPNHQVKVLQTIVRSRDTCREDFVFYADRLVRMLVEDALNLFPFADVTVQTPAGGSYAGLALATNICGVSIVRSGEAMEDALRGVHRGMKVGKVLVQRDEETAKPRLLYVNLPSDIRERYVLLCDPMLATGGSAITAIDVLLEQGVQPERLVFVTLVSCPEGIMAVSAAHPQIPICTGEVDECLNSRAYILPGLGDFGDRYFGTDQIKLLLAANKSKAI